MEPAATRKGLPSAKLVGAILGPSLFALVLLSPRPAGMSAEAQGVLALTLWMATWWMSGAAPLAATSFLPLVVLPVAGILSPREAAAPYADPNVFLFMGGFLLAAAFQKSGLHRRIALLVLSRVGDSPRRLVFAFMATTAVFSMWISNTATAVMMLPVGVAVASQLGAEVATGSKWRYGLKTVLMLGIAYAASIGGMATLVGTPPNLLFAGQVAALVPEHAPIGFLQWMLLGLPLAVVYLALAWAYLAYGILDPSQAKARMTRAEAENALPLDELGPVRQEEWIVATVFACTVLAWLTRADLPLGDITIHGWSSLLGWNVHDGTVAMAAAILLFVLPTDFKRGEFALDWPTAVSIPWEVLILFGGGFALAAAFDASGLAAWVGGLAGTLGGFPLPLLVLGLALLMVAGGEIASNTAQTALILPILASVAEGLALDPLWLMVPATLAASAGFMLPVATPPNAVAFASGHVTVPQMVRAGFALDVMGALLATAATFTLARWVFGLA